MALRIIKRRFHAINSIVNSKFCREWLFLGFHLPRPRHPSNKIFYKCTADIHWKAMTLPAENWMKGYKNGCPSIKVQCIHLGAGKALICPIAFKICRTIRSWGFLQSIYHPFSLLVHFVLHSDNWFHRRLFSFRNPVLLDTNYPTALWGPQLPNLKAKQHRSWKIR